MLLEGEHFKNPWVPAEEVAELFGLHMNALYRALARGAREYRGAKKFGGKWFVPRAAITPT
jgi:hypothetical protein